MWSWKGFSFTEVQGSQVAHEWLQNSFSKSECKIVIKAMILSKFYLFIYFLEGMNKVSWDFFNLLYIYLILFCVILSSSPPPGLHSPLQSSLLIYFPLLSPGLIFSLPHQLPGHLELWYNSNYYSFLHFLSKMHWPGRTFSSILVERNRYIVLNDKEKKSTGSKAI